MMVKFGLLELQVGFKSCTKYCCKENETGQHNYLAVYWKLFDYT
jgi:hypothetical protein